MRYNGECTVWHKSGGAYISYHYPCWWQDTEAENISKTGRTDVDRAMIHLPLSAKVEKSDYIAKGNIDFNIASSVTELLKAVNPLKVSTVERKDYGSPIMQHTEVTAK
ncbi:MAG: hypothetical protein J5994_10180 [Ruminococcus sp.]|nr:hypothetical protein [Ruminococcus sp.]